MNVKTVFLALLIVGVFLIGCTSGQNYQSYNQPSQGQQGQQQNGQYVGGGCGVAPSGSYENTPMPANPAAGV